MPTVDVKIAATGPMTAFIDRLESALERKDSGPMNTGFKQASMRYLGFTRRRFVQLSGGGGEWPDLAVSTKVRRMRKTSEAGNVHSGPLMGKYAALYKSYNKLAKVKGEPKVTQAKLAASRHFDILRDSGLLLNSLSTGGPGFLEEALPNGIRVGTTVRYARFHQSPTRLGHPPVRAIFVAPDEGTLKAIQEILANAVASAVRTVSRA